MKKKVLITGANGFIFSNFVRKALFTKSDYEFVSIDVCSESNALNNIYVNKGHKMYIGDIADKHFINIIFQIEKPDFVINGADKSFMDSLDTAPLIHSNILGTQTLIDACVKYNVEKFIQISTDKIFPLDENDLSATEESPTNPCNLFSASKLASELLVRAANQTHGLKYIITRSCNNYGPRQNPRNFIPKIVKSVLTNQPIPIYGQGKQCREWIHVEDNISAIMLLLQNDIVNETFNISSNHEFSNIEVFHEVCNIMGKGHGLLQFTDGDHDFRYSIDSSKLRKLGWKPNWKFKAGLEYTIKWYTNNQWWFRG